MRLFFILVLAAVLYGQVSVDIHIGDRKPSPPPVQEVVILPPQGYVPDCEYREDLVVISPGRVGFWVRLSSGRVVLHYRDLWYDNQSDVLYYGPWVEDHRSVCKGHYARYDDIYIVNHYPRYKGHKFHREEYKNYDKDDRDRGDKDHGKYSRGHGR